MRRLEIPFATQAEEAFRDSLTGLHDWSLFLFMLDREVKRARRYGTPFTLAMIDIDSFFQRSDRLNDIAGMVATSIRELDLAVRYSEDAFAVILAGADARSAHIAAERILRAVGKRLDGSGYPDGLRGEEIPLVVRIMAVVDVYDALVTNRPYRGAMKQEEALAVIRQSTREGKLDPGIVARLVEMVTS